MPPPTTTPSPPRLTYLVKQVELLTRAEMDRLLRDHGLTTLQYTALSVLDRHPGLSSAQLSRRSFVSAQAGHEMMSALERRGLLIRKPDLANRRILLAHLTDDGSALLHRCDELVDAMEARMLEGFSPADLDGLRKTLRRWLLAGRPTADAG